MLEVSWLTFDRVPDKLAATWWESPEKLHVSRIISLLCYRKFHDLKWWYRVKTRLLDFSCSFYHIAFDTTLAIVNTISVHSFSPPMVAKRVKQSGGREMASYHESTVTTSVRAELEQQPASCLVVHPSQSRGFCLWLWIEVLEQLSFTTGMGYIIRRVTSLRTILFKSGSLHCSWLNFPGDWSLVCLGVTLSNYTSDLGLVIRVSRRHKVAQKSISLCILMSWTVCFTLQ